MRITFRLDLCFFFVFFFVFFRSPTRTGYFLTTIFHPNVSAKGDICVNTLKKDWHSSLGLKHILLVRLANDGTCARCSRFGALADNQVPVDRAQSRVGAERRSWQTAARSLRRLLRARSRHDHCARVQESRVRRIVVAAVALTHTARSRDAVLAARAAAGLDAAESDGENQDKENTDHSANASTTPATVNAAVAAAAAASAATEPPVKRAKQQVLKKKLNRRL